jgi:selenocysteine-specific translation elongation factor
MKSMGNVTVAVLGALGYAENIGKKGTSTDITLYNLKRGEDTVTLIEPTRYPERLAPLFYAVSLAKKAIVVVDELNASFGETLVMLQCSGITSGYIILRNYIPKEKVEPLIKGTSIEKFEFTADDPNFLREQLLAEAAKQKPVEEQTVPLTCITGFSYNQSATLNLLMLPIYLRLTIKASIGLVFLSLFTSAAVCNKLSLKL